MIKRWWRGEDDQERAELKDDQPGLCGKMVGDKLIFNSRIKSQRFSIELSGKEISVANANDGAELNIDGRLVRISNPGFVVEDGTTVGDPFEVLVMYHNHDVGEHEKDGWLYIGDHTERLSLKNPVGDDVDCLYWLQCVQQKGTQRIATMRMTLASVAGKSFVVLRGDLHGDIKNDHLEDMASYLESSMSTLRRGADMIEVA